MAKKASVNLYTPEGRTELKQTTHVDTEILHYVMRNPVKNRSIEYNDNRISLYSAQIGKCAISGEMLQIGKMHCHHKLPVNMGGNDKYQNLIFVTEDVHRLIHATDQNTITAYLHLLNPDKKKLEKLNKLRVIAGLETIEQ